MGFALERVHSGTRYYCCLCFGVFFLLARCCWWASSSSWPRTVQMCAKRFNQMQILKFNQMQCAQIAIRTCAYGNVAEKPEYFNLIACLRYVLFVFCIFICSYRYVYVPCIMICFSKCHYYYYCWHCQSPVRMLLIFGIFSAILTIK